MSDDKSRAKRYESAVREKWSRKIVEKNLTLQFGVPPLGGKPAKAGTPDYIWEENLQARKILLENFINYCKIFLDKQE